MSRLAAPASAPVLRPESLGEAVEAARDAGRMLFRGGATKLSWGAAPEGIDAVVDTGGLASVLRHDPADGIAVVEAGISLAELAELLRPSGQQLAIDDPASAEGATVGGVVASAADGPRRLRYGPVRGLVLGVTLVLADGTVARGGGTVIKNVAGYDLMRLVTGSLGTLALIARVALRLHPRPTASATLETPADAEAAARATADLRASPLEPAAITWRSGEEPRLAIAFEGHPGAVEEQSEATRARLAAAGLGAAKRHRETDAPPAPRGRNGAEPATLARAATLPSALPGVAGDLAAAAAATGVEASLQSQAALGLHDAVLTGGDPAAHAACVRRWREQVTDRGGTVVVRDRPEGPADPDGIWDSATVWGPPPPGVELMGRVKAALDPQRRCAPGRFVGGL